MLKKISICIPTYNRAELLENLLRSITSQPESDQIEVCIADNCSDDNTVEMVKCFQRRYENIRIIVNKKNEGPDKNFFKAASMASGKYIWLMGSDDLLESGAIKLVLDRLSSGADIYLQDRVLCDFEMNKLKRQSWWQGQIKTRWDFSIDKIDDYFQACVSLGGVFSYLSSIVVKRDAWEQFPPPLYYFRTSYPHVYTALKVIDDHGKLELIKNSGVLCRSGNDYFASNGVCKRILIDFEGYSLLAGDLRSDALYDVLRREYSDLKYLSNLKNGCVPKEVVKCYLDRLNFGTCDWLWLNLFYYLRILKNILIKRVA